MPPSNKPFRPAGDDYDSLMSIRPLAKSPATGLGPYHGTETIPMIDKFAVAVKYGCHWLLYTDKEGSQEFDKSGAETLAKQLRSEVRPIGTMIASSVRVVQITAERGDP